MKKLKTNKKPSQGFLINKSQITTVIDYLRNNMQYISEIETLIEREPYLIGTFDYEIIKNKRIIFHLRVPNEK